MAFGTSSNYITLTKDGWSEELPPYAEGFIIVVKAANSTDNFQIDVKAIHDNSIPYADTNYTVYSNLTNSGGKYKISADSNYNRLPYWGYDLDSGTDPEYVRLYFSIRKR